MPLISVVLANGRMVEFDIRTELEGPARFLLSVRKCGSSIFNKIARAMAQANGCHYVDVAAAFFHANVVSKDYAEDSGLQAIVHAGNTYGGFRNMPVGLLASPLFQTGPKLLLIRDPRDALVSLYFSNAYSHPIPAASGDHVDVAQQMERQRGAALATNLDDYTIRNARAMKRSMLQYRRVLGNDSTTVLKYEDYIFDKRALMLVIAEKFGWRTDEELIRRILEWADVRPERENPTAFIRKVTPGDHREKLSAATILAINEIMRPAIELFGYSFDG
jgi:hypothetical protein